MTSLSPTSLKRAPRRAAAYLVAAVLALGLLYAPTSASAATGELLANADFSRGADDWRTNGSGQLLTVSKDRVATLTTTRTQNATLNDDPNAVTDVRKGSSFVVTARVRTTTPSVKGALRIREVNGSKAASSQTSFTLTGTGWQTVTLRMTTTMDRSHLDLNLVAWDLPKGKNMQISSVSLTRAQAAPAPSPKPTPTPTATPKPTTPAPAPVAPPVSSQCQAAPPAGTLIGTTVYPIGQSMEAAVSHIDKTFGRVEAVRYFSPGLPPSWSSRNAELLSGRTLILSFKVAPAEINSGRHDAFFRNWFATAPRDQTIYWSYYHEPENNINKGEFTTAQYRAAWKRLAELEATACKPNLHSTLILTEWTMNPGSKRDYKVYDAGRPYVDVIAFDPYNAMWDLERTTYDAPEKLLGHIVSKMKADGRPWGIAEMGSRLMKGDSSGAGRAAWLREIAKYTTQNKALFVAYFHGIGINGDFTLRDSASINAWKGVVSH